MVIDSRGPKAEANEGVFVPVSNGYVVDEHVLGKPRQLRVITLGAGASGLNVARQVEQHMKNVDLQIYEKNADVGGTWLENKYVPNSETKTNSHKISDTRVVRAIYHLIVTNMHGPRIQIGRNCNIKCPNLS